MSELDRLRADIEHIDRVLIRLIGARVRAARRAGLVKRAAGLPVLDPTQEAAVIERAAVFARDAGLPEDDVSDVFTRLIGLARRAETEP